MNTINAVYVNNRDNCATLTDNAEEGDTIRIIDGDKARTVTARMKIPVWHKTAISPVEKGDAIYKYGAIVGVALERIEAGDHLHVHNMRSPENKDATEYGDDSGCNRQKQEPAPCSSDPPHPENRKFYGYRRQDGKIGIRNHVVVMPGVVCADIAARRIAAATGAVYLQNPYGCGQTVADTETTLHILSGLLANPNVYGALIVGLGCEFLSEERYRAAVERKAPGKPVRYVCIQTGGSIAGTVEKGISAVCGLAEKAAECTRAECDISELMLGLECGGSDPTSGLSANIVLGEVSDRLVDMGGTTVISETAEAIGTEHILLKRGATPEIGRAIYTCVRDKEAGFTALGENIRDSDPSPGNIKAGITTLEEKSLGCIKKSGTRPFTAFAGYGDPVETRGTVFMDTPAFDAASTTAKIAGGCQTVVFTTGLGNPIGNAIAPVIKITGNSETFRNLNDMLDFETGGTLSGEKTIAQSADELMELILRVCTGELVKAEINGSDVISIDNNYMLA